MDVGENQTFLVTNILQKRMFHRRKKVWVNYFVKSIVYYYICDD